MYKGNEEHKRALTFMLSSGSFSANFLYDKHQQQDQEREHKNHGKHNDHCVFVGIFNQVYNVPAVLYYLAAVQLLIIGRHIGNAVSVGILKAVNVVRNGSPGLDFGALAVRDDGVFNVFNGVPSANLG